MAFRRLAKLWLGEPEPAIERFARALRLSPLDPLATEMRSGTATAYFFLGRYDEAASWAAMALLDKRDFQPGLRIDAASNAMAGRPEQAQKAVARLRQLYPRYVFPVSKTWWALIGMSNNSRGTKTHCGKPGCPNDHRGQDATRGYKQANFRC